MKRPVYLEDDITSYRVEYERDISVELGATPVFEVLANWVDPEDGTVIAENARTVISVTSAYVRAERIDAPEGTPTGCRLLLHKRA